MLNLGISKKRLTPLLEKMRELKVNREDILERFVRSSGPGGQNVNKLASAVYLKHLPTGIEVKYQNLRSQSLNRYYAYKILLDKIEEVQLKEIRQKRYLLEKEKRRGRGRPAWLKEKILKNKRKHSQKKQARAFLNKKDFIDQIDF